MAPARVTPLVDTVENAQEDIHLITTLGCTPGLLSSINVVPHVVTLEHPPHSSNFSLSFSIDATDAEV
jgi:hypothetical protein